MHTYTTSHSASHMENNGENNVGIILTIVATLVIYVVIASAGVLLLNTFVSQQVAHAQSDRVHGGRNVKACYDGNNNCFVNYTDGSYQDLLQTRCELVSGCSTPSSLGNSIHNGRTIQGCFSGNNNNCFVNYTNGSYKDFRRTSCSSISGCNLTGGGLHSGRSVASCYAGANNNCFVNYSDGSYKDFYQTSCQAVTGCSGSGGSGGGNVHNSRTVAGCFDGGAGNCFVNYTNGSFKDFYATSCGTLPGCSNSGNNGNNGNNNSGNNGSGNNVPPNPSSFKPPLFRQYKRSDCNYVVSAGNSFTSQLASARPGQKVCLRGGNYQGGVYVNNVIGSPNNLITLMSYPGETATIVANRNNMHGIKLLKNVQYFEIFNLDIRGSTPPGTGTPVPRHNGYPSGIVGGNDDGQPVHHIKLVNNRIRDFGGGGINLYFISHVDIQGNIVSNTSLWSDNMESGISIYKPINLGQSQNNWTDDRGEGYSILIRHNIVYDNENRAPEWVTLNNQTTRRVSDGNCIVLDSFVDSGYSGRSLINQNVCYNNGSNGLHVYDSSNAVVRNNTSINSGKTFWDTSTYRNYTLWIDTGEISNVGNSRNNVFENNLTWAEPNNKNAWNLRIEGGAAYVSGRPEERMRQSIAVMNTKIRNNMFVVSGSRAAPFLPTDNGNQVVTTNPGLVMESSRSSSGRDYRIRQGSLAHQRNVGATFFLAR